MREGEPQFNQFEPEEQKTKKQALKPKPPTGEARKLTEMIHEKWQEYLLLFSSVKNKVLEVNPDIYIPLKLEKGKTSPLGLFAEAEFQEKPQEAPEGKQILEFRPGHNRSIILGRVIFADKEGRLYRDIDMKGIGYVDSGMRRGGGEGAIVLAPKHDSYESKKAMGLLNRDTAIYDRERSEEFLKFGVRAVRTLAIIELEEIIVDGRKLSIEEIREKGIIDKDFNPVIEIRAFGTKLRNSDVYPNEKGKLFIQDAKEIVAQELGLKELSDEQYLEWFAETLGRNIGLMHKNHRFHGYLNHNITLDCRIADFDSAGRLDFRNRKKRKKDLRAAESLLSNFADNVRQKKGNADYLNKKFRNSYNEVFSLKNPLEKLLRE